MTTSTITNPEQKSKFLQEEWYSSLVDECKSIITEAVFTSRWALVEGYHKLGGRILEDEPKLTQGGSTLRQTLQGLANLLNTSERTLYYAVQSVKKYPDLQTIPEGKNITWNKLITKYLPQPKENKVEIPLPEGKYNVIYADPPWDIGSFVLEKWESPLEDKYPTMTREKLLALPIATLSAENCVCFIMNFYQNYLRTDHWRITRKKKIGLLGESRKKMRLT